MAKAIRPPRKIKMSSGHLPKHGQSIRPGLGGSIHGSLGGGFGGSFKMFPPSSSRRPARGPYRASGGSGFNLGSMLAGALLNGDSLESLAQGIGQALAGGLGGDIGEVPEAQKINTLAPAYPVECPHCGATIPAFVWVCEYCDSPRPVEDDHDAE